MSAIDSSPSFGGGDLAAVGCYPTLREAHEHVLVVLAMDFSCWLHRSADEGFTLYVEPATAHRVSGELIAYDRELTEQPESAPLELPRFPAAVWIAWIWAMALITVFFFQGVDPGITERAAADAQQIVGQGAWWQTFTALFLHADLEHIGLNIAAGMLFGILVARDIGGPLGWTLILLSGALGNALNAWFFYPDYHRSIGASTAVFGALGILTSYGFYAAFRLPSATPWASVIIPIGGGLAMLGWIGVGGENTDVSAHLLGFVAGALLGLPAAHWRLRQVDDTTP